MAMFNSYVKLPEGIPNEIWVYPQPIGSMHAIYGNIYHQYTPVLGYELLLGGELPTARKWVITPVINGISRVNPLITGIITHLLSGMSHQVQCFIVTNSYQLVQDFSVHSITNSKSNVSHLPSREFDIAMEPCLIGQWPFQEPKLEVPTIYKAYVRPM